MKKKAKFETVTDGNRDRGASIDADSVKLRKLLKPAVRKAIAKFNATKCRCREPKTHPDCMYCGCGYWGEIICGVCKEQGIDGKLIRGTGRIVCAKHKGAKS